MASEEQRKKWRDKWHKKSLESKRKKYIRDQIVKKERMEKDPEYKAKTQERERLRKQRQRKLRGDEINEQQRERYQRNAESERAKIIASRRRRDPTIGIASLIKDVRAGRKSVRELTDALSAATKQLGTLINGKS